MRDGIAEGIELAVDFAQFHDATLEAVVQPADLVFGAPELGVGLFELAVLLFKQLGVVLQQSILAGEFDENGNFGTQDFGHHGLGEIVDGADIVAAKDMLFAAAERGDEDDGRGARALALADQSSRFETVHFGHHDVQQDDGEIVGQQMAQGFAAGLGAHHILA